MSLPEVYILWVLWLMVDNLEIKSHLFRRYRKLTVENINEVKNNKGYPCDNLLYIGHT